MFFVHTQLPDRSIRLLSPRRFHVHRNGLLNPFLSHAQ